VAKCCCRKTGHSVTAEAEKADHQERAWVRKEITTAPREEERVPPFFNAALREEEEGPRMVQDMSAPREEERGDTLVCEQPQGGGERPSQFFVRYGGT
jgi:hypothetical protein